MKKTIFALFLAIAASTSLLFAGHAGVGIDGWWYELDWENYTARFFGCQLGPCNYDATYINIPTSVSYKEPLISEEEKYFTVTSIGYEALKE